MGGGGKTAGVPQAPPPTPEQLRDPLKEKVKNDPGLDSITKKELLGDLGDPSKNPYDVIGKAQKARDPTNADTILRNKIVADQSLLSEAPGLRRQTSAGAFNSVGYRSPQQTRLTYKK